MRIGAPRCAAWGGRRKGNHLSVAVENRYSNERRHCTRPRPTPPGATRNGRWGPRRINKKTKGRGGWENIKFAPSGVVAFVNISDHDIVVSRNAVGSSLIYEEHTRQVRSHHAYRDASTPGGEDRKYKEHTGQMRSHQPSVEILI